MDDIEECDHLQKIWEEEAKREKELELEQKDILIIPKAIISQTLHMDYLWPSDLTNIVNDYACDFFINAWQHDTISFATWGKNIYFDECDRGIPVTNVILPSRKVHQNTSRIRKISKIGPGELSLHVQGRFYLSDKELQLQFADFVLEPADLNKRYIGRIGNITATAYGWRLFPYLKSLKIFPV